MRKNNDRTTVLISYNRVEGFESGWHGQKRLFVCANDAGRGSNTGEGWSDNERAGSVMHSISGQYYHGAVPVKSVKEYFVYAGLYAFEQAIHIARSLRKASGKPTTLVACHCRSAQKVDMLRLTGIRIIWSECGGSRTMGELGKKAIA
ncbi:hypothetical protein A2303_05685 [Candidatus Falkowbacteria bacterium RIFOXYB2_FULL_47_14]|uniref:Uncharacterized protein n=1 Tax=Candidatus Falkowbacteria bacterium RIFOXYA2_FULL_47_19 TaxID=1797994 RepID=A0A1F5SEE4_9BACT|nr:MAG: hypothetical protein A2227_07085 [Candidatus Falkowbacteria bacterium RIFOXYA2_FULL_47_19]OGF35335.1 MAG: hypothetical protein A2468_00235 [Candidatus Falkowbacteria bacterium RIFOXYC2_FULL_46_15]OGF43777.1 MAG: hypothetical protein A2303_05685 [Candidatus Falkowbacteria bacterium RIFOXYB2_FULL_47_14]